ncbi:hypothetical protein [Bacillus dakarensis]|uniref:hypothetical protein n=1 Tax=Robertmurraya dakarensis TaxID=1926278 RepID=UPI000982607E|nr:hypothetical protein [Bacillus dakarensis]
MVENKHLLNHFIEGDRFELKSYLTYLFIQSESRSRMKKEKRKRRKEKCTRVINVHSKNPNQTIGN